MKHASQVLKFLASGGVATGINIGVLYLLTEFGHFHYLASAIAAFLIAFCFSFTLQKFWTFRDRRTHMAPTQATLYFLVSLAALAFNTALLFALVEWLHLWYVGAEILVAGIVAIGTFFAYKRVVFIEQGAAHELVRKALQKKNIHYAVLALAATITIFFATYKLSEAPAVWYDEGFYMQSSIHAALYGTQALQVAPNTFVSTEHVTVGYPLLYPISFAYRLFGIGVLQGRAVMAIFIVLFVAAAYTLSRRLFGPSAAAWSAALLATFPMLYGNGKSVLGEVPGLFYLFLSLWSLALLERSRYKSIKIFVLFGLTSGLCVATKPIYLLLLGAFFAVYLLRWKKILPDWHGVLAGGSVFIAAVALWAYLQFGQGASMHSILAYYANPYSSGNLPQLILQNALRFLKESTPLYALLLMLVWGAALWLRRKKEEISSAEISAFAFCLLVMAAYLRLPGWYRYLFPAIAVSLAFLVPSALALFARFSAMFGRLRLERLAWLPYAVFVLIAGLQLYQTAANSYVAQYYSSTNTVALSAALSPLQGRSFFIYNVPQLAVLLPTEDYYQYISITDQLKIGEEELAMLQSGAADYALADTDAYQANLGLFSRYEPYKTINHYEILQRIPNTGQK